MNAINRLRYKLYSYYGIPYENDDCFFDTFQIERVKIPSIDGCRLSIIQGTGTHGAENDLLEVWDFKEEEPYPEGKTIQETMQIIMRVFS